MLMNTSSKAALAAMLLLILAGCASTTAQVNGAGTSRSAGGSATLGTGIKF